MKASDVIGFLFALALIAVLWVATAAWFLHELSKIKGCEL